MTERLVRKTRRNADGDITALCNDGAAWSPREKDDVIRDITSGEYAYYARWTDGETKVRVVEGPEGCYLRTDKDTSSRNNLDDLPAETDENATRDAG